MMSKRKILCWLILILALIFVACAPELDQKVSCGPSTYAQNFKTDVAWIVLEWNCRPMGWGSGFLANKEKGIFRTNKHVSDMFNSLGRGSHKVFFNGRVYNAEIVKTPLLVDAALIRITDPFDSSEFPEPAKIASEKAMVDDTFFLEGFHVHPYRIREVDMADGYDFPLVPIFRDYYKFSTMNLDKEQEVVFEKLEAKVVVLDKKINLQDADRSFVQQIRNDTNLYIEVRTLKDHRFSFGGLSGTVARNSKLEIAGIVTAETQRLEDVAELDHGMTLKKVVFDTIMITPIGALEDLDQYLK